jgi:hypothetical protein
VKRYRAGKLTRPHKVAAADTAPDAALEPAGPGVPARTPLPATAQALAAHQAARAGQGDRLPPAVCTAVERQDQALRQRREDEGAFGDGLAALEQLRARAAREASPDRARARALRRLAEERAGRACPLPKTGVRRDGCQAVPVRQAGEGVVRPVGGLGRGRVPARLRGPGGNGRCVPWVVLSKGRHAFQTRKVRRQLRLFLWWRRGAGLQQEPAFSP